MQRRKPLQPHSKDPRKKAIAALDRAFSLMVRERDKAFGCITCGRQSAVMDAGHFRRRECMSTRFNPMNVNMQCAKCNRFESKGYEYGVALDSKYIKGTAALLERISKEHKQWTLNELEQLRHAARMGSAVYNQLYDEIYPVPFIDPIPHVTW